jgi:UV DNA damage endonuclease
MAGDESDSSLSEAPASEPAVEEEKTKPKAGKKAKRMPAQQEDTIAVPKPDVAAKPDTAVKKEPADKEVLPDPESEGDEDPGDEEELATALSRPPPVHSGYLPLPWKGRLGYVRTYCATFVLSCFLLANCPQACLCTYLRYSNPPVFCSRTTRIASIMERRHPLKDPNMPHHPTKNRPDRDQTPDIARGQAFIEELGLANARDLAKLIIWNEKFGIKFLRISSEMFPFASHAEYGYRLAPFASGVLAEAGRVAAELGHRLTTHPGQVSFFVSTLDSLPSHLLGE